MHNGTIITFLLIAAGLSSCDPFHSLVVVNKTDKEKRIETILPQSGILQPPDSIIVSIFTSDPQRKKLKRIPVQTKDSIKNSYSVTIEPEQQAILEFGFGSRSITQKIVIDNVDTVIIKRRSKRLFKNPKFALGGEYQLTLND